MISRSTRRLRAKLASRAVGGMVIAAVIALSGGAGAAIAVADGGNTSAVAVNTRDGSSVFRLAFAIHQVSGSVVDNQNAAVAYSSCTACQTVAISIQVLLISSDPSIFTPTNEAIAINQNCDLCDTLAAAYQFALGIDTRVKFTAAGRQSIAQIRQQLEALRNSGLTGPQIDAQVNVLMNQLANILQTQIIGVTEPANQGTAPSAPAATTAPGATSTVPTDTSAPSTTSTPSTASTPSTTQTTTPTDTTSTATTTTTPTTTTTTTTTPQTTTTTAP